MKLAIPVFRTRVSPRFDCAQSVLIVTIDEGKIADRKEIIVGQRHPLERVKTLVDYGVKVLICGGIDDFTAHQCNVSGIDLVPWVTGETETILSYYCKGKLQPGMMLCPGGGRRYRFGKGKGGRGMGRMQGPWKGK